MNKNLVTVLSAINSSSKISKETIDGKEHFIVRDVVPVVDDVVMNGGLYPKSEIDKSYLSINGNLMPLGHPKVGSNFVSANDPKAINEYYGGAWAENVRKDSDKVLLDAYVDIEFASNHKKGKQLIERLESMMNGENVDPIHVSTGLLLNKSYQSGKSKGKAFNWVASNMQFDHVAILLNEQGAATPDEGVGMFVNSEGSFNIEQAKLVDSVNFTDTKLSKIFKFFTGNTETSFDEIYSMISSKLRADNVDQYPYITAIYPNYFIYELSNKQFKRSYLIDNNEINFVGEAVEVKRLVTYDEIKTNGDNEAMKTKILEALKAAKVETDGLTDDELLKAYDNLSKDKPKAKEEKKPQTNNDEMPDWAKLLANKVDSLHTQLNANADAEQANMRAVVKAKFNLTDVAVNALSGDPLKELFSQCQSTTSLNSASFQPNANESVCDMPE